MTDSKPAKNLNGKGDDYPIDSLGGTEAPQRGAGSRGAAQCCKKFAGFLFSTIGTTVVMVAYTILGGFVFNQLEAPHEEQTKSEIRSILDQTVNSLSNLTLASNNDSLPENWTALAFELLSNYTREIYTATKTNGWDGQIVQAEGEEGAGGVELQWGFAGALLYAITVVTTIGYGHIAPKTDWGMACTILYAIVGIPLTLLTITNIGHAMATAFRFLYRNLLSILCCLCCRHSFVRSLNSEPPESDPESSPADSNLRKNLRLLTTDMAIIEKVNVPIPVTICLIAGYIGIGSLLFGIWEGWKPLESAYFCFVTVSTIGFGDYVPGTDFEKPGTQVKLVLCALYLFMGLAFLAMCFDLMQEGAKNAFRQMGRKCGLVAEVEE